MYRFPVERAAKIAVKTICEFLKTDKFFQQVLMVCFDEETKEAYLNALEEYKEKKTDILLGLKKKLIWRTAAFVVRFFFEKALYRRSPNKSKKIMLS